MTMRAQHPGRKNRLTARILGRGTLRVGCAVACTILPLSATALAQDGVDAAVQANNPLASITSLNLQNQFTGRLSGFNEPANSVLLRAAQPFAIGGSRWIARATLPINTFPRQPGGPHDTGIGDFNIFAAYLIDVGNPGISFGIGPQLTAPTGTERSVGSGQWAAGFANVLFVATNPAWQYGYLLTWQARIAGGANRPGVNVGNFQPFVFRQLGDGWYLRSSAVWNYNFDNNAYSVPLGLGIGRVVPLGKAVLNAFVEPQYSVLRHGPGQPEWGVFAGLNFQFRF